MLQLNLMSAVGGIFSVGQVTIVVSILIQQDFVYVSCRKRVSAQMTAVPFTQQEDKQLASCTRRSSKSMGPGPGPLTSEKMPPPLHFVPLVQMVLLLT